MSGKSKSMAVDLTANEPPAASVPRSVAEPAKFAIKANNRFRSAHDQAVITSNLKLGDSVSVGARFGNGEEEEDEDEDSICAHSDSSDNVVLKVIGSPDVLGRRVVGMQNCRFSQEGFPIPSPDGDRERTGPVLFLDDGGMLFAVQADGMPANVSAKPINSILCSP